MSVLHYLLLAIFCLWLVYYCLDIKRLQKKRNRFSTRESLSIDEIYNVYYSDANISREMFKHYWAIIGKILHVDGRKLRPSDSFRKELAPVPGWKIGDETEGIYEYFSAIAKDRGNNITWEHIDTINDLIMVMIEDSGQSANQVQSIE